ncbi:MAG: helix-turn-helix domain-containing protein [Acetobacteraceae bacterium]|nr:helix-turn-helix domain-containing protein [Acetobacteraceae bacterium]
METIARSRTEPASRVERARNLLAYRADPSSTAVGERIGVTHQTVQRCLRRAARLGVLAALDDSPRPGKAPQITQEAKVWLVSLACQKAHDLGYPHELWTTRLLARHARGHAGAAGHPCLSNIAQGTVCKILARHDLKPHKVRYYLERRDEAFEEKMAEVLCVYREVEMLRDGDAAEPNVAIISYDEKPGIQASSTQFGAGWSRDGVCRPYVDHIKRGTGANGIVQNPDRIVRMRVAADAQAG